MIPIKIITVAESRELETQANKQGMRFEEMMENAGRQTAEVIRRHVEVKGKRVVVLVGPGNNGGDGLVAAHYLWGMGARVSCYIWKRSVEGDGHYQRVESDGMPVCWADDDEEGEALRGLLAGADVVIDALLGVGVELPLREPLRALLGTVSDSLADRRSAPGLEVVVPLHVGEPPLVVAVDCPTGLDADTGEIDPAAVQADLTVTFAYPKVGLLRFPGADAVGRLVVADIGIPPELADDVELEMAGSEEVRGWLPRRSDSAHKGTFGSVLIVAGSINYVGAAVLAGAGASRVGAGLVTMALPGPIQSAVAANLPEVTYLLLPHDLGVVSRGAVEVLRKRMGEYDTLLLGPGLTQEKETVSFVHAFLGIGHQERKGRIGFLTGGEAEVAEGVALPPLVIDADGLNALAQAGEWWKMLPPGTILTPHPGEMARLVGGEMEVKGIQADREGIARRFAAEWNVVLVLKGAHTVVAAPDGRRRVLPFANAGLATAGTGDVAAGAIAGLRAQGLDAFEAAVAGAYAHGLAGEMVRADLGNMGAVAGDLPRRLPLALARIRREVVER
ncbi:MAG: NAD(P)H-hydrate dehydratase [Anaerolineae bacterium]|nr:NAD(P)H-hydrate dehydratase [Anaerolineae bacterium]